MKLLSFLKGHLVGTVIILVIYAMLPLDWRFSRALIFLGSLWAILAPWVQASFHLAGFRDYRN